MEFVLFICGFANRYTYTVRSFNAYKGASSMRLGLAVRVREPFG